MTLTKRKSGFTLIELLIVIGIIAVLAAIAIPAVAGIINKAGTTRDNSNASNMSNALEQWTLEYPLFYNDYQSGTDTDDEVGSRVRSAIKNMGYISKIEDSKLRGFAGKIVDKETFYPKGDENEIIAIRVIGILKTYLKSNIDILTPHQSDAAFWYLTDTATIICAPFDASQAELFALAGNKGSENPSGTWINLTDYSNEALKGDAILTLGVQGMGGEISGNGTYKVGDYVHISAGASSEEFKGWYDDTGVLITTENEHSFVIIENTTLVARYGNGCQLVLTASGPGTVSGGGQYATNASVTVNATPTGTSSFDGWFDNGVLVSTSTSYTFNINTDVNLTAKFTNISYNVTLNSDGSGLTAGGGMYANGTSVTVSATPSAGYKFVGWYSGGTKVSDNASYTFTMSGNKTLTAKFEAVTYTITAEVTLVKGDISLDKNKMDNLPTIFGVGTYNHGQQYTISVTTNSDWVVTKITNGSSTVSTNSSYVTTANGNVNYVVYCEYQRDVGEIMLPSGSTYTTVDGTTYPANSYWEDMPEPQEGDTYSDGDYIYEFSTGNYGTEMGWNVTVKETSKSKTTLPDILPIVNEIPVIGIEHGFSDCAIITAPRIPDTVKYMESAFANCSNLTTLPNIPTDVCDIYETFVNCTSLTEVNINIPSNVEYFYRAFAGCTSLKKATITGGADTVYANYLFYGCNKLETATVKIGINVSTNFEQIFYGCSSLKTINNDIFDNGVNPSLEYAFYSCSSLTDLSGITIPTTVTNINYMFANCSSLKYVPKIPQSATNMVSLFANCTSLITTMNEPIIFNSTECSTPSSVFYGVTKQLYIASDNNNTAPKSIMQLLDAYTNVTLVVNKTDISAHGQNGYQIDLSGSAIYSTGFSKYNFTPVGTGYYEFSVFDYGYGFVYRYCYECGTRNGPSDISSFSYDSHGWLFNATSKTLIAHDDDEGGYMNGDDSYSGSYYAYCDYCGNDVYFAPSNGWYYTPYIYTSLTANQSYDYFVAPHSYQSYQDTYKSYILINKAS